MPTGPSGARRRLRRGGYRTRTEAERALTGLRQPLPADPRRELVTTGQWLQHWLATRLRPRPATQRSYHQHRLYPLVRLITLVGLRRGEACALRWCDVDLHQRALLVCRQLQQHNGELTLCDTKTASSVRMIALDRLTITVAVWPQLLDTQIAEGDL